MKNKTKKNIENEITENKKNNLVTNILIFIGVVILCIILICLMKYFFVDKSDIKKNYSTDKKLVYITMKGQEELIATQKYMSDLGYSMRYDIERFKVFKYKNQDIYRFIDNERVIVLVEKSSIPNDCKSEPLETGYSNCYKYIDETMDEYYITANNKTYKILVKTPGGSEFAEGVKVRISYMISTFGINE